MEIQIRDLKEGKTGFDFGKQRSEILEIRKKSGIVVKEFEVRGFITKSRLEYFLKLNVKTKVNLECARCLERFNRTFEEKGEYYIKIGRDRLLKKRDVEIQEDDINTIYLNEPVLNLVPLVRELILLALPMKPLCQENCRGLCPVCGKNRNTEKCDCEMEIKTPLSALKKMLKKEER
jgi:uncharacterized protein